MKNVLLILLVGMISLTSCTDEVQIEDTPTVEEVVVDASEFRRLENELSDTYAMARLLNDYSQKPKIDSLRFEIEKVLNPTAYK